MADIYVRSPDGEIVVIDDSQQQAAVNQGYQPVDDATIRRAQETRAGAVGSQQAAAEGLGQLPEGYNAPQAFAEKALSAATFGLAPGLDSPEAIAGGRKFADEHPVAAFGAEVVGGLPLAIAGGVAGGALRAGAAGAGAAARAGAFAADVGINALVGGAQAEAEETRLSGEDFSWTDAAVTGLAGETIGRGAAWGVAKAVGGSRNLMARGARDLVAQDAAASLTKGGWLADYRVAQHAEAYQNELAELAARDLDTLEESFAEVSRQDRKRARITRVVADAPEVQGPIRMQAAEQLRGLRDALSEELADAGGPAKKLLKQLDDRIAALDDAPGGRKLWRILDENRQALQEYRQDLHQSYESNPGSAWLSREGLAAIDAAEKSTREALLREDAWGAAAAQMQREYNVPFHEKYFPTAKTVRQQLMFSPAKNAEGFPVYRGEPGHLRRFLGRDAADPDAHRLAEQFRDYLDGVEAIARAGQKDTPQAAHRTLEAVRRLRRAVANAGQISEAVSRTRGRSGLVTSGVELAGAVATGVAAGPGAGALGYAALRGARIGDFLQRAGQRLGWGRGRALSMAKLLEKDALPAPTGRDAPVVDDLLDAAERPPPTEPPPSGPSGGGGGLTPSMRADAARGSWRPTPVPDSGVRASRATGVDDLAPEPDADLAAAGRESRTERAARPTTPVTGREVGRGQQERLELDGLRDLAGPARREAKRLEALTETEFRDVVGELRASGAPEARELADELEANVDELVDQELVAAPTLDEVDEFYRRRSAQDVVPPPARGRAGAGAGSAAIQSSGLNIRMGAPRVAETLDLVFGAGRAPTAEQWRRIAPLDVLRQLGEVERADIDVLGDAFIWSAEGKRTLVQPHNTPAGLLDPGGYEDQTWSISRTFSRDPNGRLEVHHDHFMVRGDLQATGVGAKVLKEMMDVYRKVGVDVVSVDSIEVGKYFWPSIGFDCPPESLVRAKKAYGEWLAKTHGPDVAAAAAKDVQAVKSLPSLAQLEYGKEFLLSERGNWNFDLRLELKDENPLYHLMRGRLDIAAAAVAGLGTAWEGARKPDEASPAAQAGALGGLALFGRRASLFKTAKAKVVADVAKRLFSATAEPTARVAARLTYNRHELKARQEEFQAWQANPQELVDRVAEGFRDVPPEHSGVVAAGVFKTATFLKQRLPSVTKLNAVSLRQIPVSTEAMNKYARYEQAALRPREALQDGAATGHLSAELLETLGELYPDLLAELRVGAIMQVRENGPPTTVQARLTYARLFDGRGELADPAFSATVASMTAYAYEQSVPVQPGGGPTSSGNVSHVAAASAPPRGLGAA